MLTLSFLRQSYSLVNQKKKHYYAHVKVQNIHILVFTSDPWVQMHRVYKKNSSNTFRKKKPILLWSLLYTIMTFFWIWKCDIKSLLAEDGIMNKYWTTSFLSEVVVISSTQFHMTDLTSEWWGKNTPPNVGHGAGNLVSKPGELWWVRID